MTELVGRNTWQQGLTLPLQGCQQQQQRVCSEQSARLMPGQTGFNRQPAVAGPSSVRMPRMELVVPAVGTVRCPPAGLAQDGLQLDLRQLSCVLRWEEEKCSQRHNHSNLHICKIRQEG